MASANSRRFNARFMPAGDQVNRRAQSLPPLIARFLHPGYFPRMHPARLLSGDTND
jgi:hypothetical protein